MKTFLFLFATLLANLVGGHVINEDLIVVGTMNCNSVSFDDPTSAITAAANQALQYKTFNETVGPDPEDQYPEDFSEILQLAPGCDSSALFKYPLTASPSGYQNSTNPGPFRVVVNFVSEDVRLCAVVYNPADEPAQSFWPCPWRTGVNNGRV